MQTSGTESDRCSFSLCSRIFLEADDCRWGLSTRSSINVPVFAQRNNYTSRLVVLHIDTVRNPQTVQQVCRFRSDLRDPAPPQTLLRAEWSHFLGPQGAERWRRRWQRGSSTQRRCLNVFIEPLKPFALTK